MHLQQGRNQMVWFSLPSVTKWLIMTARAVLAVEAEAAVIRRKVGLPQRHLHWGNLFQGWPKCWLSHHCNSIFITFQMQGLLSHPQLFIIIDNCFSDSAHWCHYGKIEEEADAGERDETWETGRRGRHLCMWLRWCCRMRQRLPRRWPQAWFARLWWATPALWRGKMAYQSLPIVTRSGGKLFQWIPHLM